MNNGVDSGDASSIQPGHQAAIITSHEHFQPPGRVIPSIEVVHHRVQIDGWTTRHHTTRDVPKNTWLIHLALLDFLLPHRWLLKHEVGHESFFSHVAPHGKHLYVEVHCTEGKLEG